MMSRVRKIAAVAGFFLLIALPMLVQILGRNPDDGAWENRILAPPPPWPPHLETLARDTKAWLDDHYGLRRPLVELANHLRFSLFGQSGNPQLAFGRHHELFFTSHEAAHPQELLDFLCLGPGTPAGDRYLADQLSHFLDAALRHNPRVIDLVIPTKTILDAADLPGWMRARCRNGHPALPALLDALGAARPDLRPHVVYPLALMKSLRGPQTPYPTVNFHWDGAALRTIAATVAQQDFHRPRLATLRTRIVEKNSDIAHLLPGVPLSFKTTEPDLAASGVLYSPAIPELGAAGRILYDNSEYHRHAGPRLLLISDSFGQAIAPWFSPFYGEVWHVSVNNLAQLSPAQRTKLTNTLFETYRPDDLLFVFHDFSQGFINQQLMPLLWQQP